MKALLLPLLLAVACHHQRPPLVPGDTAPPSTPEVHPAARAPVGVTQLQLPDGDRRLAVNHLVAGAEDAVEASMSWGRHLSRQRGRGRTAARDVTPAPAGPPLTRQRGATAPIWSGAPKRSREPGPIVAAEVCNDRTPEVDRAAVHATVIQRTIPFLDRALGVGAPTPTVRQPTRP